MNSTMLVTLMLGSMLGASVVFVFYSLRARPVPLNDVLQTLHGGSGISVLSPPPQASIEERVGEFAAGVISKRSETLRDLAVVERSLEQHALTKVTAPALIILASYGVWMLMLLVGVPISALWAGVIGVSLAAVSFIVPDVRLRAEATARRLEFRHALSAYLDLVVVIMAGGGGILTGLQHAAEAGAGWSFDKIRESLDFARLSGRAPWDEFANLAARYDIDELAELAAAADLAGGEGAKISDSVATKAAVLRARLSSEVEAAAESRTEKMVVPLMGFATALFLFLGFAVAQALLADDVSPVVGDGTPEFSSTFTNTEGADG